MSDIKERIESALQEIRPFLQNDGGDIQLHSVIDNVEARVVLLGACLGCSVNQMTLKNGVEVAIKKFAPEIQRVIHVTDQS
jgi:Fe-S cluster biogenesis protein NfuA|tara:strand:- start:1434 stop:1676 length:243 start_codon:yes stop_codon:yes gene_type:complete